MPEIDLLPCGPPRRTVTLRRLRRVIVVTAFDFMGAWSAGSEAAPLTILHRHLADGINPYGGLMADGTGWLYGTTYYGGRLGEGTLFRQREDGSDHRVLVDFNRGSLGANPYSAMTPGGDGRLYGTTSSGGPFGAGVVFSIAADGSDLTVLHHLDGLDGQQPYAPLLVAGTTLYGSTLAGGSAGSGVLFTLQTDGSGFAVIRHFAGGASDGKQPYGRLLLLGGDTLYGTTFFGGAANLGLVFRVKTDNTGFTILKSFTGSDGAHPVSDLVHVPGLFNELFGMTYDGGTSGFGVVFRVRTNGADFTVLHHFAGGADGAHPVASLVRAPSGMFYGTTYRGGTADAGTVFEISSSGASYQRLHTFVGGAGDGVYPETSVVLGSDGSLYGTTVYGGDDNLGTVFRQPLTVGGSTLLHEFRLDGDQPDGGLTRGEPGRLYGTLVHGGAQGRGAVFGMNDDGGGYALIHSFAGGVGDGSGGRGGVVFVPPDLLYGTAPFGGAFGSGVLYRMKTDGSQMTILHSFSSASDNGAAPFSRPTYDGDATLYGTTTRGGVSDSGTIYRIGLDGTGFLQLHSFTGGADGRSPIGPVELADGWVYAATLRGGPTDFGTLVRQQIAGGGYDVLHVFAGPPADGRDPADGVVLGPDGRLFGLTRFGGPGFGGTLYATTGAPGSYQLVHWFPQFANGFFPRGSPRIGPDGALYGVTVQGGDFNHGTIYRVTTDGSTSESVHSFDPAVGRSATSPLIVGGRLFGQFYESGTAAGLGQGAEFAFDLPTIFADGFESGDTAAWSSGAP